MHDELLSASIAIVEKYDRLSARRCTSRYIISFFYLMSMPVKKSKRREVEALSEDQIRRSKISAGQVSPELTKNIKEKYGIPLAYISDPQWEDVQKLTGLPHSARFEVNIALRRYWDLRIRNQSPNPETIKAIDNARDAIDAALDALIPLMTREEELYKGRIIHFEQSALEQHLQLERCLEVMSRTEKLLSRMQDRLERSKRPGKPGYGPLIELVHHLDYVLYSFKGVNVSRSTNKISKMVTGSPLDFVRAVLKIADLEVSESTIDTIVRDYVKIRKKGGHEFDTYPQP